MDEDRITRSRTQDDVLRGQVMKTPDDVSEMLRLKACGWGAKRIARELGCSHHTVKAYVAAGGDAVQDAGSSTAMRTGCVSGFSGTAATPTWWARTWSRRRGSA